MVTGARCMRGKRMCVACALCMAHGAWRGARCWVAATRPILALALALYNPHSNPDQRHGQLRRRGGPGLAHRGHAGGARVGGGAGGGAQALDGLGELRGHGQPGLGRRVGYRVRARARVRARISSTRYAGMDKTLTPSHSPLTGELRGHGQPCLLQREHRHAPRRRQVFVRRAAGRPRLTARGPRHRRRNVTRASLLVGGAPAAHEVFGRLRLRLWALGCYWLFILPGGQVHSRPWTGAHR